MEMANIKVLITLFISLAFVICGCGKHSPGFKIYRHHNSVLIFLALQDTSEIVDTSIDNDTKELQLDIGTGQEVVNHVMSLKRKLMVSLIKPDETLKIKGTDRINGYGVIHVNVLSLRPNRGSMSVNWTGLKKRGIPQQAGLFNNSGAFRVGDRMFAYCRIPETIESSLEISKFGVTIEVHESVTFENLETDTEGNTVLEIVTGDEEIGSQKLSFVLKDLQSDETVEVENKQKLGDDVFLVNLKVVPKNNQNINDDILLDR